MKDILIAYFAGFFDGEGYVGVSHSEKNKYMVLSVTVTQNTLPVLEMLRERFGGNIIFPKHYYEKAGKASYTWAIYSETALNFLNTIKDFVIVKKAQVEIALQFPIGHPRQEVMPHIREKRLWVRSELQRLKKESSVKTNLIPGNACKSLSDREDVKEAVRLYESGLSQEEVSTKLNIKYATIGYWLRSLKKNRSRVEAGKLAGRTRRTNLVEARVT